jgi:hypothetical protein
VDRWVSIVDKGGLFYEGSGEWGVPSCVCMRVSRYQCNYDVLPPGTLRRQGKPMNKFKVRWFALHYDGIEAI